MPIPTLGQPLPRARDALAREEKWAGWILAPRGHGAEWALVSRVGPEDRETIWNAIAAGALTAAVSELRDLGRHGIVCGVEMTLTIGDRTARVMTSWCYDHRGAAPRLVTAYPHL